MRPSLRVSRLRTAAGTFAFAALLAVAAGSTNDIGRPERVARSVSASDIGWPVPVSVASDIGWPVPVSVANDIGWPAPRTA